MRRLLATHGRGITGNLHAVREDIHSVRKYVMENVDVLEDFLLFTYPEEGHDERLWEILQDPYVARTLIENFNTPNSAKWDRVIEHHVQHPTGVTVVIGRKRNWKTITTCDLVDSIWRRTGRPGPYAIGSQDPEALPPHFKHAKSLEDLPKDAIALWDEAGVEAGSRTTMSGDQRSLPGQIAISGHNGWRIFVVVQNTKIMDPGFIANVDDYMVKPIGMSQAEFERGPIRSILRKWGRLLPREKWETLYLSKEMNPWFFVRPIPDFWDQDYSRAYKNIQTLEEAVRLVAGLHEVGKSWKTIRSRLSQRGWTRSEKFWQRALKGADGEPVAPLSE